MLVVCRTMPVRREAQACVGIKVRILKAAKGEPRVKTQRRHSEDTAKTQHDTAQHSTAQHSTAQHSTAQHSTAQHSTAQHSTAHPPREGFTEGNACRTSSKLLLGPETHSLKSALPSGLARCRNLAASPSSEAAAASAGKQVLYAGDHTSACFAKAVRRLIGPAAHDRQTVSYKQHSTAQHSTAQHSTAQNSTAQHTVRRWSKLLRQK